MKGEYNAVTQSASGEIGRADYQESRKNTAMTGGVIIAIIVVLAGVVYLFWKELTGTISAAADKVSSAVPQMPDLSKVAPLPSINDVQYYAQNAGKTVAADGSTYMGVPADKGTEVRAALDYFANLGMPFDDPLHNVDTPGSAANLSMTQKLVNKLNQGAEITVDERGWAKVFEPSLYHMIVDAQSKGANL